MTSTFDAAVAVAAGLDLAVGAASLIWWRAPNPRARRWYALAALAALVFSLDALASLALSRSTGDFVWSWRLHVLACAVFVAAWMCFVSAHVHGEVRFLERGIAALCVIIGVGALAADTLAGGGVAMQTDAWLGGTYVVRRSGIGADVALLVHLAVAVPLWRLGQAAWRGGAGARALFGAFFLFVVADLVDVLVWRGVTSGPRVESLAQAFVLLVGAAGIVRFGTASARSRPGFEVGAAMSARHFAEIGHELRAPLHAILGMSQALQEEVYGPLTARQLASLRAIESSGRELLRLVSNVVELSRIETGSVALASQPIALAPFVGESVTLVRDAAEELGLGIDLRFEHDDATVDADPARLRQTIVGLLEVAVARSSRGGTLTVRVGDDVATGEVRIEICEPRDRGAPESVPPGPVSAGSGEVRQRADRAGTQLGLRLVARCAELIGGGLEVHGDVERSRCYAFSMRRWRGVARVGPTASGRGAGRAWLDGVRERPALDVLVVEDNLTGLRAMRHYLERRGHQVAIATTGEAAIEAVGRQRFDVVVMDVRLPGVGGLEALTRIQARLGAMAPPVVVLSGLATPEDEAAALGAGARAYMDKPVRLATLLATVERLARGRSDA